MKTKRLIFAFAAVGLLAAEILIGAYAGGFVRSYIGDVLVVVLIFALLRAFTPKKPKLLALYVMLFAFAVEFLQITSYFGIINENTPQLIRIIAGSSFSVWDLVSYAAGALLCAVFEIIVTKATKQS